MPGIRAAAVLQRRHGDLTALARHGYPAFQGRKAKGRRQTRSQDGRTDEHAFRAELGRNQPFR